MAKVEQGKLPCLSWLPWSFGNLFFRSSMGEEKERLLERGGSCASRATPIAVNMEICGIGKL